MTQFRNRYGTFCITQDLLRDGPESALLAMFDGVIVVDVDHHIVEGCVTYYAYSSHFDPSVDGCLAPEYRCVFTQTSDPHTMTAEWERVTPEIHPDAKERVCK